MAKVCNCAQGLSNTGLPGCVPIQGVTSSLILVPLKDNDNNKNGIDLAVAITPTTWSDLVNQADASKRWFPLPHFEDVTLPKADTQFAEAASGRQAKLRQGKRSFQGSLWEESSSPQYLGKLEKAGCVDFGFYIVTVNGNLVGSYDEDTNFLYPIPADKASWDPKIMFSEDDQVPHIQLNFDWYRLFDESTMKMLTVTEAGQDFTELEGLIDIQFQNESSTASTQIVAFDAELCYGTALNPIKYMGATTVTDWEVTVNGGAPITPTLVTENPDGTYALTLPLASFVATDEVIASVTRDGFSGSVTTTAVA